MGVSEAQLEAWSLAISSDSHASAYAQVNSALAADPQLAGKSYETFLQGSYRNGTTIQPHSDVDIVVQLNESYYHDTSALPPDQQRCFHAIGPAAANYASWCAFKAQVIQALEAQSPGGVTLGNKSIQIAGPSESAKIHVIAGYQYRRYLKFTPHEAKYLEGTIFFTRDETSLISYPKLHCENSLRKNERSGGRFKQFIRIFKHVKRCLVGSREISEQSVPSYGVEGLLYNVPDEALRLSTFHEGMEAILQLVRRSDLAQLKTVCGVSLLCGERQWDLADARRFIDAVARYCHA